MQTVPYILGVAHPPGFPAFVILGYVFSHVFVIGNVAWRLSLLSAIAVAGATWFAYRAMRDLEVHPALACLSSWTFAFGAAVWTRGTRAEIHAVAIFFISAAIWSALRTRATGKEFFLYVCAASVGLAGATHPVAMWILPGILLLMATARKWRWQTAALAFLTAATPLLLYFYMPLRSLVLSARHVDPTLALGLPAGQPFWDYGHTANLHNFILQITGAQFPEKTHALGAFLNVTSYFDFADAFGSKALAEFGIITLAIAAIGFIRLAFRDRINALALALITICGVPFALSYAIEIDYDRYFFTAYWAIAVLTGVGAQALVPRSIPRTLGRGALAIVSIVLFGAVVWSLYLNRDIFSQHQDSSGERFVDRIVRETPRNSIIAAPWIFATPLAYAAYVEHRLGRRTVADGSTHPRQIANLLPIWAQTRPVFVIHFETDPHFLPCARLRLIDGSETPLVYRLVFDPKAAQAARSADIRSERRAVLSSTNGIYPDGWTARRASFQVTVPPTAHRIMLDIVVPPRAYKPGREGVGLTLDDQPRESRHDLPTGPQTLSFPVPASIRGRTIPAEISVDASFVPARLGINADRRQLGVVMRGTSFLVAQSVAPRHAQQPCPRNAKATSR